MKKHCEDCCPVCGYKENMADEQDFDGEFCLEFTCEQCGTYYCEVFTYGYTTWEPKTK